MGQVLLKGTKTTYMNLGRTNMRRIILCGLVVGSCLAFSRADAKPCESVVVEPVRALSVQQVGQLASRQTQSNSAYTALLWSFDVEDRPRRQGMTSIGFLLVSTGDLGAQPVGALIWVSKLVNAQLQKNTEDGFNIVVGDAGATCSQSIVSIHVLADGTVLADSKNLGKVK